MLTGGMEDVYNPLLFGLNPSLSGALCQSVKGQGPHIFTHLSSASSDLKSTNLCHTQSFTSQLHKHPNSQEPSLKALMSLVSQIFPWWSDLIVMKIKNISFNFLKDLSYHVDTDSLSFSLTKWYGIFWAACVRERHLYLPYHHCLPKLRSDIHY